MRPNRLRPSTARVQRVVHGLTAVAVALVAGGLWLGRAREPDLPAVYRQADLEVTGLT